MQQYGTSYKRGSLFFPKKLRKEVYVVYAFVRAADQLVDTVGINLTDAVKQLTTFHQQTKDAREGKTAESPLIQEFVTIAHKYDFSWEWIEAFFASMLLDTHKHTYLTYAELQTYMHGSAEVI
jgi:phytoene synthase